MCAFIPQRTKESTVLWDVRRSFEASKARADSAWQLLFGMMPKQLSLQENRSSERVCPAASHLPMRRRSNIHAVTVRVKPLQW